MLQFLIFSHKDTTINRNHQIFGQINAFLRGFIRYPTSFRKYSMSFEKFSMSILQKSWRSSEVRKFGSSDI